MPSVFKFRIIGKMMREKDGLKVKNSIVKGSPAWLVRTPFFIDHPAAFKSRDALRKFFRSCPVPLVLGESFISSKTLLLSLSLNGVRRASSASLGSPVALNSEFSK